MATNIYPYNCSAKVKINTTINIFKRYFRGVSFGSGNARRFILTASNE